MRDESFKTWLDSLGTMGKRPISDVISRCRRIENGLCLDLDEEFAKDKGGSVITLLKYTAEDEKRNCPVAPGLDFAPGANLKNGMASLRSAAKKYFEFCQLFK